MPSGSKIKVSEAKLSIHMPLVLREALQELAVKRERSEGWLIRAAIHEYLKKEGAMTPQLELQLGPAADE